MNMDEIIIMRALQTALDCGASQASALYDRAEMSETKARGGEIDSVFSSRSASLCIQLFVEGRFGSFTTNRLSDDDLVRFIRTAASDVRFLAPDPYRRLPDPSLCFMGPVPDLGQYDPSFGSTDSDSRRKTALDCALEVFGESDLVSVETEYDDEDDVMTLADTNGFLKTVRTTRFTLSAECSVTGEGDIKPEGFRYDGAMFLKDLDVNGISSEALRRARAKRGASKLPSGKYTALIENTCSSKLVAPVAAALQGGALYRKNSFLEGKYGEKVFSENFTLVDDPLTPGFYGSSPFDCEGVATRRRTVIDCGVVRDFFLDTYYAAKIGMPQTVSSPSVLRIGSFGLPQGAAGDIDSMLSAAGCGILVTGFNGGNCDGTTGEFSYGVEGFFFEDGKIMHPVSGMNITGNLLSLWSGLTAAGSDARRCSKWQIPSLTFDQVDFNGN